MSGRILTGPYMAGRRRRKPSPHAERYAATDRIRDRVLECMVDARAHDITVSQVLVILAQVIEESPDPNPPEETNE